MKKEKSQKKTLWIVLLGIALISIVGICVWYFQIKKPHDQAVAKFNVVISKIEEKNKELDKVISDAKSLMNSESKPYDENTITELTTTIADAESAKISIPELPDTTQEIVNQTKNLEKPIDYTDSIKAIEEKSTAFKNSILQMQQIINPTESFVIQRIQGIDGISGIQAVTEDHDPNGNLNKQGGYTATIYFSSPLINQDEVYGNDIVDKGTDGGGCIEVYATSEEAENRNTYLSSFDGSGFLNSGSHTVLGSIVIRTSAKLTATEQTNLTQSISDKLIELQ